MGCNTVVLDGCFSLEIEGAAELDLIIPEHGETGVITALREGYPEYTGETVIVPSQERQILHTSMSTVLSNITVEPIPSNYGLITWNGTTLTVS